MAVGLILILVYYWVMNETNIANIKSVLETFPSRLGVVSTISEDGKPHVASVYFTFDDNLNLYFVTRASTGKYKNTLINPNIAFVTSVEVPPRTVQIEGIVSEVNDPKEQEKFFAELLKITNEKYPAPPFTQMMNSEVMLMKITPTWARLADFDVLREHDTFQEVNSTI